MEEIRNIHLYQEISSYEDSSQGFCSLIHNLCFSPGQEEAELPNLGEEAEAEGRGSVIVRNGCHDLGDSGDSRAQAEERTQEKLPVLTYLGRLRGRDVSGNLLQLHLIPCCIINMAWHGRWAWMLDDLRLCLVDV